MTETTKVNNKVFNGDVMNMFVLYCDSDWNPLRLYKMSRIEYTKIPRSFIDKDDIVKVYTWYEEKDLITYINEKYSFEKIVTNVWTFKDLQEVW